MAVDFSGSKRRGNTILAKWPFFLSACFIAGLTFIFAYLQYAETGEIGTWQLLGCIFGIGTCEYPSFLSTICREGPVP